jgi:hypothetical protein
MHLRTVASVAALSAGLAAASGCATAHFARVIGRDNIAAGVTVGGPFTDIGLPVKTPLPIAVGWAKLGTGDRTDAYMELGLTTLAFGRFLWGFGGVFQIVEQRGALPGIAGHAGITLLTDFREARFWPQLGLAASWKFGRASLVYLGVDSFSELDPVRMRVAPLVGAELRFTDNFAFTLEGKWYEPGYDARDRAVPDYLSIAGHGALGVVLGISFYFDRDRP